MSHKVAIYKINDIIDPEEIKHGINESIDYVGGIKSIVKSGDKVILKPNIGGPCHPKTAANTSLIFVEYLIEQVLDTGGEPIVVEGPSTSMGYDPKITFKITGIRELCARNKVQLINANTAETKMIDIPNGKTMKKMQIPNIILEADKLINIPKIKTHRLTSISCSLKNLMGLAPGPYKPLMHVRGLAQSIVDLNKAVKSDLIVADGLNAMEGLGPFFGDTIPLGVILCGNNVTALDSIVSRIMGLNPQEVDHIKIALEDFNIIPDKIELFGKPITDVKKVFKIPSEKSYFLFLLHVALTFDVYFYRKISGGKMIFPYLSKKFGTHPKIDRMRCDSCGLCVNHCPTSAISAEKKKIDTKNCVDCLICFDHCPKNAIIVK